MLKLHENSNIVKSLHDFRLTVFQDNRAKCKNEFTYSLSGLYEHLFLTRAETKMELPLISGCRFGDLRSDKGSLRHNQNVLGINAIIGEHDAGIMSFHEAVCLLSGAGVIGLLYTSPSHTAAAPRWRAVVPLSSEQPPSQHGPLMDRLNGILGGALAGECWTLSQSFYAGFLETGPDQRVEIVQ